MTTINPTTGRPNHMVKIARNPADGFTGTGATKKKNAMPSAWLKEILTHAMNQSKNRTVIDLCAGWQGLRPVCEQLGLNYIAVDIVGDRNIKAAIVASMQENS